jgi:hypothetical protein
MRRSNVLRFAVASALMVGCGSSNHTTNGADGTMDAGSPDAGFTPPPGGPDAGSPDATPSTNNVAPMIVNAGPPGSGSTDVPFVSVTLCVPGTTTCQTIDYVSVDTGSSGLRILASALSGGLALPQAIATTGDSLTECYTFDDGYVWGSVRLADLKIGGEVAAKLPIQLISDPGFPAVPGDCSSTGPSEGTLESFGANGIIGINQMVPDCGDYCSDPTNVQTGAYYSCTGSTCAAVAVAVADQVPNPIAEFGADNNGAILQFPTVAAAGAPTLTGSLVFGIGTAANNGLGAATVLTVDDYGNFTTLYKGNTFSTSFFDSGTSALSFNDSSILACSAPYLSGFYCPTSSLGLTAQNVGRNSVMSTVSFTVESAATLFANASYTAFDDIALEGVDNDTFDWGFPFFIGRNVYVALDGADTPGGKGPYFAY